MEAAAAHMQLFLAGVVSVYKPTPLELEKIVLKALDEFRDLIAAELGGQ